MRLYISGPMTGYPEYNYPAFEEAATYLRSLGYEVISPHEINDADDTDHPWEWFLRRDIAQLVTADAIVVLPKWWESKGARLETDIGARLEMPIYLLDEMREAGDAA